MASVPLTIAPVILAGHLRLASCCHEWQDFECLLHSCHWIPCAQKIVLLALLGVAPFEFGVICEVFGIDRSEMGGPSVVFTIAAAAPGRVRMSLGFDMIIEAGLDEAADSFAEVAEVAE